MDILQTIKHSLRVTNDIFDLDINDLIEACKIDLVTSGVNITNDTDPLILRAITVYCKAHFSQDNPDYEKLLSCYESIKTKMSICGRYK